MPKFFYTDCVITHLKQIDFHRDEFSAQINGRTAKRLVMTHELYHHLIGADSRAKSRVWFYAPGLNKALVIAAVQPADHKHGVLRNRSISSPDKIVTRTLLAALLAWFATWALMAIPVLSWYGANAQKGVLVLEALSIQVGAGVAALSLSYWLWIRVKMHRLASWQRGDIARYTQANSPASEPASPTPHFFVVVDEPREAASADAVVAKPVCTST